MKLVAVYEDTTCSYIAIAQCTAIFSHCNCSHLLYVMWEGVFAVTVLYLLTAASLGFMCGGSLDEAL